MTCKSLILISSPVQHLNVQLWGFKLITSFVELSGWQRDKQVWSVDLDTENGNEQRNYFHPGARVLLLGGTVGAGIVALPVKTAMDGNIACPNNLKLPYYVCEVSSWDVNLL